MAVLKQTFAVYQSIGKDDAHTVTFSSYYEPTLSARLTPDAQFRYPIYGRPKDLIDVDLGLFDPGLAGRPHCRDAATDSGSSLITRAKILIA